MKIKFLLGLAMAGLLGMVTGCVDTPDGHSMAGVPFVKDSIVSRYQRPVPQVAAATRAVLARNGRLLIDNVVNNTFEAKVNQSTVWVKVTDVDGRITQVSVLARKGVAGAVELAAEMSKQIAMQLEAAPSTQ